LRRISTPAKPIEKRTPLRIKYQATGTIFSPRLISS
jgi:hypothetical protein